MMGKPTPQRKGKRGPSPHTAAGHRGEAPKQVPYTGSLDEAANLQVATSPDETKAVESERTDGAVRGGKQVPTLDTAREAVQGCSEMHRVLDSIVESFYTHTLLESSKQSRLDVRETAGEDLASSGGAVSGESPSSRKVPHHGKYTMGDALRVAPVLSSGAMGNSCAAGTTSAADTEYFPSQPTEGESSNCFSRRTGSGLDSENSVAWSLNDESSALEDRKDILLQRELEKQEKRCAEVALQMLKQHILNEEDDEQQQRALAGLRLDSGVTIHLPKESHATLDSELFTKQGLIDARDIIEDMDSQQASAGPFLGHLFKHPTADLDARCEQVGDRERAAQCGSNKALPAVPTAAPRRSLPLVHSPSSKTVERERSSNFLEGNRPVQKNYSVATQRRRTQQRNEGSEIPRYKLPATKLQFVDRKKESCPFKVEPDAVVGVLFRPSSVTDKKAQLLIHTEEGTFAIAVLCVRELPQLLKIPPLIDCGVRLCGERAEVRFSLANEGGEAGFEFISSEEAANVQPCRSAVAHQESLTSDANPGERRVLNEEPFSLSPRAFVLKKHETVELRICFDTVGAGVFERLVRLRSDAGQVWPVTLRGTATPVQLQIVRFQDEPCTTEALFKTLPISECAGCPFSADGNSLDLLDGKALEDAAALALPRAIDFGFAQVEPAAIFLEQKKEVEFKFSYFLLGSSGSQPDFAQAILEVVGVPRPCLLPLRDLLQIQLQEPAYCGSLPVPLWPREVHKLDSVEDTENSSLWSATLLAFSLHGCPVAPRVSLIPATAAIQVVPCSFSSTAESVALVNAGSADTPFSIPVNLEYIPVHEEMDTEEDLSCNTVSTRPKPCLALLTQEEVRCAIQPPQCCTASAETTTQGGEVYTPSRHLSEELLLRLRTDQTGFPFSWLQAERWGESRSLPKGCIGYISVEPRSGRVAAHSNVLVAIRVYAHKCTKISLTLPILLGSGTEDHIRNDEIQLDSGRNCSTEEVPAKDYCNLHLVIEAKPPRLRLTSPATLDFGIVRAHDLACMTCTIANPSDAPTIARPRLLSYNCDPSTSLSPNGNAGSTSCLEAQDIPALPFKCYAELHKYLSHKDSADALAQMCAPEEENICLPEEVPPANERVTRQWSTTESSSACARCGCVDRSNARLKELLYGYEEVGQTRKEGPGLTNEAYETDSERQNGSVLFVPPWSVVPARGYTTIRVILRTKHPEKLRRYVTVDWLEASAGIFFDIVAEVQLPQIHLHPSALTVGECEINIAKDLDPGTLRLENTSGLPATFRWERVPVGKALGEVPSPPSEKLGDSPSHEKIEPFSEALEVRFDPPSGVVPPRSSLLVSVQLWARRVTRVLRAAAACHVQGLLRPLYLMVQTRCRGLRLQYAMLNQQQWTDLLQLRRDQHSTADGEKGGHEGAASDQNLVSGALPECHLVEQRRLAKTRSLEVDERGLRIEGESEGGSPPLTNVRDLQTLGVTQRYLLLTNISNLVTTFAISATRYPARCSDRAALASQGRGAGFSNALPDLSDPLRRSAQASHAQGHVSSYSFLSKTPGHGIFGEAVHSVESFSSAYSQRNGSPQTDRPSENRHDILGCRAFRSVPGYSSAEGNLHCLSKMEGRRRAALLSSGAGLAIHCFPASGTIPSQASTCICVEFLSDFPGEFHDQLALALESCAIPLGKKEPADVHHSRCGQSLRAELKLPLRISVVGDFLRLAPPQLGVDLARQPCPLLSVASYSFSASGKMQWSPGALSRRNLHAAADQVATLKQVIPLNSLAAAAGVALDQMRSDPTPQTSIRNQTAVSPKTLGSGKPNRVTDGVFQRKTRWNSRIPKPLEGTLRLSNTSPCDVSVRWTAFDLCLWDRQRREEVRQRRKREAAERACMKREEGLAAAIAAEEAARAREQELELQRQQEAEAAALAAAAAVVPSSPGRGRQQRKGNSSGLGTASTVTVKTDKTSGSTVQALPKDKTGSPSTVASSRSTISGLRPGGEVNGQVGKEVPAAQLCAASSSEDSRQIALDLEQQQKRPSTPKTDELVDDDIFDLPAPDLLLPPDTCVVREWQREGNLCDTADVLPLPIAVVPSQCVIPAQSSVSFRVVMDGLRDVCGEHRFRLVCTAILKHRRIRSGIGRRRGCQSPSSGPLMQNTATLPRNSHKERTRTDDSPLEPPALSAHSPRVRDPAVQIQRRAPRESVCHVCEEVARLPPIPGVFSDEEEKGQRTRISPMRRPRSGQRQDSLDASQHVVLQKGNPPSPSASFQGEVKTPPVVTAVYGAQGEAANQLLVDVTCRVYEPAVSVATCDEPCRTLASILPKGPHTHPQHSSTAKDSEKESESSSVLAVFCATPCARADPQEATEGWGKPHMCTSLVAGAQRGTCEPLDVREHTVYVTNPLPCDIHFTLAVEGDFFKIKGMLSQKGTEIWPAQPSQGQEVGVLALILQRSPRSTLGVDRVSSADCTAVGAPVIERRRQSSIQLHEGCCCCVLVGSQQRLFCLKPFHKLQVYICFEPPPWQEWQSSPSWTVRGYLKASFPFAPSYTQERRWILEATCRRPAISLDLDCAVPYTKTPVEQPVPHTPSMRSSDETQNVSNMLHFGCVHIARQLPRKRAIRFHSIGPVPVHWSITHVRDNLSLEPRRSHHGASDKQPCVDDAFQTIVDTGLSKTKYEMVPLWATEVAYGLYQKKDIHSHEIDKCVTAPTLYCFYQEALGFAGFTDDPRVFIFEISKGILQGQGAGDLNSRGHVRTPESSCCQTISISFLPVACANYRSRFRVDVQFGNPVEFVLEGLGTTEEEDDVL